jgi:two-component system response regulator HydG
MSEHAAQRILIADDEPLFLQTTAALLNKAGYQSVCAADGDAALAALRREPIDLVLSDLNMPGNFKLEMLREGRERWPEIPLIVVTGAPSLPTAIESVRLGIADYLLKPIKYEDLLSSVRRALSHRPQHHEEDLDQSPQSLARAFPEIVGESQALAELLEIIARVAVTDANVLVTGESGTGKEVVARAIHRRSSRRDGPFQVVDCTAIPETLFESVLFGHARGSFTGAVKDQAGLLSQADGGTVFFDEIGELPAALQAKLLRVIQEQTFTPVGKTTPITVDARFICATNRDLELEVNAGRFRQDLYYRLAVIHIDLPPLRDRGDDIVLLARHFLKELQQQTPRVTEFAPQSLELLRRYRWPGNIRELRNAVERGIALARETAIAPADLPPALRKADGGDGPSDAAATFKSSASSRSETMGDAEREYLASLLRENSGNVAGSARQAGMSRQGMHKLLKKHGLDAADFRR